ncbi:hypothetical protein [Xanthomonas oryzae]|nr:hypothetical protein [Xanthomonas oryzae]
MLQLVLPSTATPDAPLEAARTLIEQALAGARPRPLVASFFLTKPRSR